MADNLSKDYIASARSARHFGKSRDGALSAQALAHPTVSILGLDIASTFSIAFLVELIFNWPGLARYGMQSMLHKDLNSISAVILVLGAVLSPSTSSLILSLPVGSAHPAERGQKRVDRMAQQVNIGKGFAATFTAQQIAHWNARPGARTWDALGTSSRAMPCLSSAPRRL